MARDIFHSEPMPGAIEIDATGETDGLILDMTNGQGDVFHFEIINRDESFLPPKEIKLPTGSAVKEDLNKHKIIIRFPK